MSKRTHKQANPEGAPPPKAGGVLRRKCACGTHTTAGSECSACAKGREDGVLRRSAARQSREEEVPPVVNDVLRSGGQPLDASTRSLMEPRFGHDFSHVRVHTGGEAAESARAVDALAYTVGNQVVFGAGQYAPQTDAGQRLLTHELTHVVQAGGASRGPAVALGRPDSAEERHAEHNEASPDAHAQAHAGGDLTLRRSVGGFFANIGRGIADLFTGSEPGYDKKTLDDYLEFLRKQNKIEDDYDSDNKARAVVAQDLFQAETLTVKTLLVEEMISGATLDDDELAIIAILESLSLDERGKIAEAVTYPVLYDNFHGAELDRLYTLLPAMNSFHPRGKNESKTYTFEEYIKKWEAENGAVMTPEERETLAYGCIGISALNIGEILGNPDLSNCYDTFEQAWNASRKMNAALAALHPDRKTLIFSKRFWADRQSDFKPDPATGKVDMSTPHPGRPDYINFDYGLYEEKTGKWWHANHCNSDVLTDCVDQYGNPMGTMKVYESNLQHYSRDLLDFNAQVFCVAVSKRT
jgi:hypothetical protein